MLKSCLDKDLLASYINGEIWKSQKIFKEPAKQMLAMKNHEFQALKTKGNSVRVVIKDYLKKQRLAVGLF